MTQSFRPLLAGKATRENTKCPVAVSPKIDGIRCCIPEGIPLTRSLKQVPNHHVREVLSNPLFKGMDGELIGSAATGSEAFVKTTSAIMSHEGTPNFSYLVFDLIKYDSTPWLDRNYELCEWFDKHGSKFPFLLKVPIFICSSWDEIVACDEAFREEKWEGTMIRKLDSPYKFGRSTDAEGYLMKLKPYQDSEGRIVGFEELMINNNPALVNELGRTFRSSSARNKVGANTLGTLILEDLYTGLPIRIGTGQGLTKELRKHIWENKSSYLGKIVQYYFMPPTDLLPRHPVMLRFRDERDTEFSGVIVL